MRSPNWDARSKHRERQRALWRSTICTVCVSEPLYVCVIYLYLYLYLYSYLYVYFYVIPDLFVLAAPHVAPPSLYVCVRMRVYVPFTYVCDMHNSGLLIYYYVYVLSYCLVWFTVYRLPNYLCLLCDKHFTFLSCIYICISFEHITSCLFLSVYSDREVHNQCNKLHALTRAGTVCVLWGQVSIRLQCLSNQTT